MEKFSTSVLAKYVGISFCMLAIIFCWVTMTVLTGNLLLGTLKPLFYVNIKDLFATSEMALKTTFAIVIPFCGIAAFAFEGSAFWFKIQSEDKKSFWFSFVSGLLSTVGMLRKITLNFNEPFQFACDLLVYFIIGFMFPILVYNLTEVLTKMLNEKTENGLTISQIMKVAFQKEILAILKNDTQPQPKANRFDVLLGGLAPEENENITTTYKPKYNAGT